MDRRLKLQELLEALLGSENVYFQPSVNTEIEYDCIIYERSKLDVVHADNLPYQAHDRYQVTAIYMDPDSDLPRKIALLPLCSHASHFTADNLYHDVFNLYF